MSSVVDDLPGPVPRDFVFNRLGPWPTDEFIHRVVSAIRAGGIPAGIAEIQIMFPKVHPEDCRLWASYVKICDEGGTQPNRFILDSFRTISWFEAFTAGEGASLAPELIAAFTSMSGTTYSPQAQSTTSPPQAQSTTNPKNLAPDAGVDSSIPNIPPIPRFLQRRAVNIIFGSVVIHQLTVSEHCTCSHGRMN